MSSCLTIEKTRQRAAASRHSPLAQCQDDLIEREVRSIFDEGKDLLGMLLLQRGRASPAPHGFTSPVLAKAMHPSDRGTDADLETVPPLHAGNLLLQQSE
jgi:hypothetical protein